MSVMAGLTPQSSVFTFESTVHSSQVLHSLNEQRCRDMLCDVTVLVDGQSFRAHRSVLASCSEYFLQKISSFRQHGAVITLPEEVTVAGFEALLKFAYTSKLHFRKDNVLEIRNSASILGFRDLDEACFDFLLPKFFLGRNGSAAIVQKTCCRKECKRRASKENCGRDSDDVLLDDKEVKPVADSLPEQDVTWDCNKSVSNKIDNNRTDCLGCVAEVINDPIIQGPKYRKFQLACEKGMLASEKCSINSVTSGIKDGCVISCLPCPNQAYCKRETVVDFTRNPPSSPWIESKGGAEELWEIKKHNEKTESCGKKCTVYTSMEDTTEQEKNQCCKVEENNIETFEEEMECPSGIISSEIRRIKTLSPKPSSIFCERALLPFCPLIGYSVDSTITKSAGHDICVVGITESKTPRDTAATIPSPFQQNEMSEDDVKNPEEASQQGRKCEQTSNMERPAIIRENSKERSTVEKERPIPLSTHQQNFLDCEEGCSIDAYGGCVQSSSPEGSNLQNTLGSTNTGCQFYKEFDQMNCTMVECEGTTQSSLSSVNSGEDGDSETETEGDSVLSASERALQVQLPFSVDWILNLNRNDFQHLLKQQVLSHEQLEFVHDIRRRSKNRLAAQRCRKRKLDCICNLQCEINKLKTEREKLIMEKNLLNQTKMDTCRSVSTLCRRVCSESNLKPEELQVLASCTDCPLSSLFPQIDALLSQHGSSFHPQNAALKEDTFSTNTDSSTELTW